VRPGTDHRSRLRVDQRLEQALQRLMDNITSIGGPNLERIVDAGFRRRAGPGIGRIGA